METKMKKIETEKHVLMTRIGELNSNENKYETKYLEERAKTVCYWLGWRKRTRLYN